MKYELVNLTFEIAHACDCSVFDVLEQDTEDVIMVVNFMIEKGTENKQSSHNQPQSQSQPTRKKVNSATATGGWY